MKMFNIIAWLLSISMVTVAVTSMHGAEDRRTQVIRITNGSAGDSVQIDQDQSDTSFESSGTKGIGAQSGPDQSEGAAEQSLSPAVIYNDSGVIALEQKKPQQAVKYLKRALELDSLYARASYNLGIAYQSLNHIEQAVNAYKTASRLRPEYYEPVFNLGCLYSDLGHDDEAIDWLTRATEIVRGDRSAPAFLNLGNIYRRLGNEKKAEDSYRKALRYRPAMIEPRFNLGLLLKGEKRYAEAVTEFERVKAFKYLPAKLFRNLGICYSNIDSLAQAAQAYQEWARRDSTNSGAWYNLAIVRGRMGDTLGTIDAYQMALLVDSTHEEAAYNLALLYNKQGNIDGARYYYKLATRIDPSYSKAYYNLALTFSKAGQYDSAAYYYTRVVDLDPENSRARFNLALAYRKAGQLDLAIQTYSALVDMDPTDHGAIKNLGVAYYEAEQYDSAYFYFNRLVKLTHDPSAYFDRAKSYSRLDSLEKAKEDYREAIRLKPDYGAARHNLAILERDSGNLNEAVRQLEEALKYDSTSWKRYWILGQIYIKLGEAEKARAAYEAAARLNPTSDRFQHELDSIKGN